MKFSWLQYVSIPNQRWCCLPVAEHFSCIVKVLFTLLYTQALVALSVKGSEEDLSAWKHAGTLRKVVSPELRLTQWFGKPFKLGME